MRTLAAAMLLAGLLSATAQAQVGTVATTSGTVEMSPEGVPEWRPLAAGEALRPGQQIRTASNGWTRLLFADDSIAVLGSQSSVRLEEDTSDRTPRLVLHLSAGKLRVVTTEGGAGGARFEVETPSAVVERRGNEYVVIYDAVRGDTSVVDVSGTVEVLSVLGVMGKPVTLRARSSTTVGKGAFPTAPIEMSEDAVAALRRSLDPVVSADDSLLSGFTGADSAAVKETLQGTPMAPPPHAAPPPPPAESLPPPRRLLGPPLSGGGLPPGIPQR